MGFDANSEVEDDDFKREVSKQSVQIKPSQSEM